MASTSINAVKPLITSALQKEENGQPPAICYYEYVNCVKQILDILWIDASNAQTDQCWDSNQISQQAKILKLASSCMERASTQLNSIPVTPACNSASLPPNLTREPSDYVPVCSKSLSKSMTNSYDCRSGDVAYSSRLPTAIESPTEIALKRNKLLTVAFQKKVQSGKFTYSQLSQMRLTLQRSLSENLRIAKSKETSFGKQIEQNICSQQMFIDSQRSRYDVLDDFNNFGLYKSSINFEFHFLTNDQWYQRLKLNKNNDTHFSNCFIYLLKLNEHPLRAHLNEIISKAADKFLAINYNDSESSKTEFLKISQDFMNEVQNVARIFSILLSDKDDTYPLLDCLEKFIFNGSITSTIFDVIRKCNSLELDCFQQHMCLTTTAQAELIGLKKDFQFLDDSTAYNGPITDLLKLLQCNAPCEKIILLTSGITSLVEYIRDKMPPGKKGVGADELLPALCFTLLQSRNSDLVLHCKFLEAFITDDKIEGADGYTLTTFITAVTFCCTT